MYDAEWHRDAIRERLTLITDAFECSGQLAILIHELSDSRRVWDETLILVVLSVAES